MAAMGLSKSHCIGDRWIGYERPKKEVRLLLTAKSKAQHRQLTQVIIFC